MKRINYYIMSMALAVAAAGCSDDVNSEIPQANAGDEVQFSVALPGSNARTVYGDESPDGTKIPIYWVNGDKVMVASPDCNVKMAEYAVTVSGTMQSFADALTKTGAAGVQWGTSNTANFYSIFPSTGANLTIGSDNKVTASLTIAATQHSVMTENTDHFKAEPKEMNNVIMYAINKEVERTATSVDLRYNPYSTVIEFEINAPKEASANVTGSIYVRTLTLTAPTGTNIAGDFTFNFPDKEDGTPTISNVSGGSNAITLHFAEDNEYKTALTTTKAMLKAKMCLMPIADVTSMAGWTVELNTSAGTFSKTLDDVETGTLKAGQVHKIQLPTLSYSSSEWNYTLGDWITSLPDYKNIYLTEISLPGAWYTGSTMSYQNTTSISELWEGGVRAFGVECRSYTPRSGILGAGDLTNTSPTRICVSGGGSEKNGAYTHQWAQESKITYISTIISNIVSNMNNEEYAVLVLSYAGEGSGGHRALDYNYFLAGIANEITTSGATNVVTSEINANTTIENVLGKLIIIVNVDENTKSGTLADNSNVLLSYTPLYSQITEENKVGPYYSNLHWNSWSSSNAVKTTTSSSTDFQWCFHSANRTSTSTSDIPTYTDRQNALSTMMNHSKAIYAQSSHNVWFYFNAGGTNATSSTEDTDSSAPTTFATTMNPWLLSTIQAKTDPSPLGIVMFNQCTNDTYSGPAIVKEIIEMNSKFYLKHSNDNSGTTSSGSSSNDQVATTEVGDSPLPVGGDAF